MDVRGREDRPQALQFVLITGKDKWSYNAPGQPRGVTLTHGTVPTQTVEVPPLSVVTAGDVQ